MYRLFLSIFFGLSNFFSRLVVFGICSVVVVMTIGSTGAISFWVLGMGDTTTVFRAPVSAASLGGQSHMTSTNNFTPPSPMLLGGPSALGKRYVDSKFEVAFSCKFIL